MPRCWRQGSEVQYLYRGPCALQEEPGGLVAWPLAGEERRVTGLQGGIETRCAGEGRYQLLACTSTPTPSCLILCRFSVFTRCKKLGIYRAIGRTRWPSQIYKSPLISRRGAGCKSSSSVHPIPSSPPSTTADELRGDSPPSPPIFDPTRSPSSRSEAPSHHPGCRRPTSPRPYMCPAAKPPKTARPAISAFVAVSVGTKSASEARLTRLGVCAFDTATG